MGMLIQPVLRPVLQPVLRSIFDPGIGGGGTPSLTAQVQALFAKYGAAGGMWDATDLSTLRQNSDGTGAVTTAGTPVGYAEDLSGNGWHQIQATASARPAIAIDGNGVYFLQPDGVDDFLARTVSSITAPWTIGATGIRDMIAYVWVDTGVGAFASQRGVLNASGAAVGVTGLTVSGYSQYALCSMVLYRESGNYKAMLDGVVSASTVVDPGNAAITIARLLKSGDSNPIRTKTYRAFMIGAEMSFADVQLVSDWLMEAMP